MATLRLPMAYPIELRNSSTDKGSKMVNCYVESDGTNTYAIKRPGLPDSGIHLGAGTGQGLTTYKNKIHAVVANTFYKVTGTTPSTIGTLTGNSQQCYFTSTINENYLFFQKGDSGYTYDGTTLLKIDPTSIGFVYVDAGGNGYGSVPNVVFSAPPSGTTATGHAVIAGGVVTDIIIDNYGSGYVTPPTVTIDPPGGSGTQALASAQLNGFPEGSIVPGTAYLDGYVFVMTTDGKIWTSEPENPNLWNALNYVTAEQEPDLGVALAKHFNYLVAFGQWSTQFFYDAGNAIGSPLLPNTTMTIEFGCASGDSVVQMEQTVVWVGVGRNTGRMVLMLDGTRPVQVSDASIERILNAADLSQVTAYSVKISGHYFYVLNLVNENITLVLDIKARQWSIWTSYNSGQEDILDGSFYTSYNNQHFTLDISDGKVYNISESAYSDEAGPIQFRIRTPLIDADSTKRKFLSRLEIVGDKVSSTLRIRHTDDDYQNWSPYRNVNLGDNRSVLYQNGSFRRRAYEFFNTDDVPLRLNYCEVDVEPGSV